MPKGCGGGHHRSGCGHSGGGWSRYAIRMASHGNWAAGGYRPPVYYTQEAMDALQANIAKKQAADAARLAQQGTPYGGHPLQQQRPDLQYGTVETRWSERAQYGQDHIADRYLDQHRLAENLGGQISDAFQQTNDNQRHGK